MTEFYLITGFLGAGKTTFLTNFLPQFTSRKLRLIINEFGTTGVDGTLLKDMDDTLQEICGGSIFCSCKLDRFANALEDCLATQPDVIIVESSGLSDPTNIKKILDSYQQKDQLVYKGCICLVDAVRFHKVFATALVCKKQLAVSDMVIINKTDLVTPDELTTLTQTVTSYFPFANIVNSSFGKVDFDTETLHSKQQAVVDSDSHLPDITLQKMAVAINPTMSLYQLERFVHLFANDSARIKGFVRLDNTGMVLVDCVGGMVNITPTTQSDVSENLNVLATKGQPLRKALLSAISFYPEYATLIK